MKENDAIRNLTAIGSRSYSSPNDRVLVACPTYRGKVYCLEAYIRAYNNFLYPQRELYMVDNTGTGLKYYEHLKSIGVPCAHVPPTNDWQETFAMCWKKIVERAVERECNWILSIESDNICPPLTVDAMLNLAGYTRAVHVAHSYPWHRGQATEGRLIGLGCNLLLTELVTDIFSRDSWLTGAVESELYEYPKLKGYPVVEIHNLLDINHLDDDKAAEFYIFKRPEIPKLPPDGANGYRGVERKPMIYKDTYEEWRRGMADARSIHGNS